MKLKFIIYHSSLIISKSAGFTLIELMVVVGIAAILGVLGIAGFVEFNKNQALQSSAREVATMLNLAKSRAQSQVKLGSSCGSLSTLEGYVVDVDTSTRKYKLSSKCSGFPSLLEEKTLPQNVTFKTPDTVPASYFFPWQKGGVEMGVPEGRIVISSSGKEKTIKVNSLGGVSIE